MNRTYRVEVINAHETTDFYIVNADNIIEACNKILTIVDGGRISAISETSTIIVR